MAGEAGDGEGKEGLVGAADLDAGCVAPVLCCAGCEDGAVHAVAHEAEGQGPEQDEGDIEEDGEFRGEAAAAVDDAGEDEFEEREDGCNEELKNRG